MMTSQTIAWICMTHLLLFSSILYLKKTNRKANRLLACIMFCFGYVHLNHLIIQTHVVATAPWMHWFAAACFPLIFLIGPCYLQYAAVMTGTNIQWKRYAWLHIFPFAAPLAYVSSFFLKTEGEIISFYENAMLVQPAEANLVLAVATLQSIFYWSWTVKIVVKYNSNLKSTPYASKMNLHWLTWITLSLISLSILIIPLSLYLVQSDITILYLVYPIISTSIYMTLFYKSMNFPSAEEEKVQLMKWERDQIAKDLHDELGGCLSKLTVISERIESHTLASAHLKKYGKSLRETSSQLTENMQLMMWSLKPENQSCDRFIARTREIFYDFLEPFDIQHEFILSAPSNERYCFEYKVLKELYPVLKEALHNAVKHAQAATILLKLSFHENMAEISVADDGVGFNPTAVDQRGLRNMKQRIENIGGSFAIITAHNQGTAIRISGIPLHIKSHPHENKVSLG